MSNIVTTGPAKSDSFTRLFGWHQETSKRVAPAIFAKMPRFALVDPMTGWETSMAATPGKLILSDFELKINGKYTLNIAQEIGDCTSWGSKHSAESLSLSEIALGNAPYSFQEVVSYYIYSWERVLVGGGQINGDGGVGMWLCEGFPKYGTIFYNYPGIQPYSGRLAKKWGDTTPDPAWLKDGQTHLVKTTAPVTTAQQVVDAVLNGHPVCVCSDVGFEANNMRPDSEGFHHRGGSWPHCMAIIGVDTKYKRPYGIIRNSWGEDVHGQLVDFDTGAKLPGGCLRVDLDVIGQMVSQQDSFAMSSYDGFPANYTKLEKALFDVF